MPTYKYKCRDCESSFSVQSTLKEKDEGLNLVCPECGAEDVFQLFDSIGVVGGSSSSSSCSTQSSCSACSGC